MKAQSKETKNSKGDYIKSVAWLIEATFRGYAAAMLLVHFRHNYVADVAGIYAGVTSALIVVTHFVKAHK